MKRIVTVAGLSLMAVGAVLWFGFGTSARPVGIIVVSIGAASLLTAVAGIRLPATGYSRNHSGRKRPTDNSYAQNPHFAVNSRYAQNPRYSQDPRFTVDD